MIYHDIFEKVKAAGRELAQIPDNVRNRVLTGLADAVIRNKDMLLAANADDLSRMDRRDPMYDRLMLTARRIDDIARDMRHVAELPSPLGHTCGMKTLPNGLRLWRVSVPFGVIGVIYESRPNVSFDVFSLCFKSGNACILKGGHNAESSNRAIVGLIKDTLRDNGLCPRHSVELLPPTHEAAAELLAAVGYVDLCIPRGGKRLIQFVRDTARVPVIETGAGVVNTYFDADGGRQGGQDLCRRRCAQSTERPISETPAAASRIRQLRHRVHGLHDVGEDRAVTRRRTSPHRRLRLWAQ